MEPKKTLKINMTDHRPVIIDKSEWPVVASAHGDSCAAKDYSRQQQAKAQGELDEYHLVVRQHFDHEFPMFLVYGIFGAAKAWTGNEHAAAGELIKNENELPSAIRRIGERCKLPESIICECVNDLEPEEM